jgi:hypothetical protein
LSEDTIFCALPAAAFVAKGSKFFRAFSAALSAYAFLIASKSALISFIARSSLYVNFL